MRTLFALLACAMAFQVTAKPNINDMQQCQALLDFLEKKLATPPTQYSKEQVQTAKLGLEEYDAFIQTEIVTPGLLAFNGGDKSKADAMQQQVDAFKSTVVSALDKRYPSQKLVMDHVISLNECTKKAVPSGEELDDLKRSMEALIALVRTQ
ncbi:hypothetical protein INR79_07335 [Vibrio sp. SCSIO 43132]|uniref:hypothetical protein n=1 Tax=Vibrio sp. SCSIO 43132 TaxID=2779363 RepID=UPI001CA9523B|nr:hypothetical protein [Vibrio sp. SCSIO 43132]UAB71700.1 hypothetical protein INR79_07335 [Vibrio sp. SCSIO 43132]